MKWTLGVVTGLALAVSAIGCSAPSIEPSYASSVSSTLASYKATAETTQKYGIVKWRLRHAADGTVLEGLDAKGKSVSHVSVAVRKGTNSKAAMFWFSGNDKRQGFMKGSSTGLAKLSMPGTLPGWATAANRDLQKYAATGKTPYGCAEDIFSILGSLLQGAPSCAKTDTLQGCVSKLMSNGGLSKAANVLSSCKPSSTGSSSSSSSSGSTGTKTSGSKDDSSKDDSSKDDSSKDSSSKDDSSKDDSSKDDSSKDSSSKDSSSKDSSSTKEDDSEDEKSEVKKDDSSEDSKIGKVDEQDPETKTDDQQKQEDQKQDEQQDSETEEAGEVPTVSDDGTATASVKF